MRKALRFRLLTIPEGAFDDPGFYYPFITTDVATQKIPAAAPRILDQSSCRAVRSPRSSALNSGLSLRMSGHNSEGGALADEMIFVPARIQERLFGQGGDFVV
jgi:hypothetical protein